MVEAARKGEVLLYTFSAQGQLFLGVFDPEAERDLAYFPVK